MILFLSSTQINSHPLLKVSNSYAKAQKELAMQEQASIKVSQDLVSREAKWAKKMLVHSVQDLMMRT